MGKLDCQSDLADAERIPPLGFADKVPGADAPVFEASVNARARSQLTQSCWKRFGSAA
jgi:hypothetical protein